MRDQLLAFLNRLLTIQTTDADTQRRGRLLSILLLSVLVLACLLTVINLAELLSWPSPTDMPWLPLAVLLDGVGMLFLMGLLYLNRSGRTRLASHVLLIVWVIAAPMLFNVSTLDRVILIYAAPVMASSFIMSRSSSFIFALLSAMGYTLAYVNNPAPPSYNYVSILGLFLMATVAWLAASSLENALRNTRQALAREHAAQEQVRRLNEDLERRARELTALNNAGRAMTSTLNPDAVLQRVIDEVKSLLDAEGASVLLRDPTSDDLIFAAAAGPSAEGLAGMRLPVTAGIAGWVMRERESLVVSDAQGDPRFYDRIDATTGLITRSVVAVPLTFKGATWGVVEAINRATDTFDEHDREILEALASSAAIAIENARLYEAEREQFRRLQQSQAQLIQVEKMAALGRLAASIAHEINNPLQAVQYSIELAQEGMESSLPQERLARHLNMARGEIDRLATIVRRMRDFYRPTREGLQPTAVHAVLDSVLELTGKQLQHGHVTVERGWAERLPTIQANPDYLKQVFLNLVLNAIDAMSTHGGTLRVRTALDQMQQRSDNRRLPAIRIEFADTGEGIPPETLSRLFEPFFTSKESGTGLGLSISYGLIEAHNGQITATSQMGVGTTFTILLPVGEA